MVATHQAPVKWYEDRLPRATRRALVFLSDQAWLKRSQWYLAGGTALALQAGHRQSVDLDFFLPQSDFATAKLLTHFSKDVWTTDILREGTVYGRLLGAKVSFIAYPFFKPTAPSWYGMVRVLRPEDIAVMKIIAISQRGRKRDFVDLYWYCMHRESLEHIVRRLPIQYPTVAHDYHHIVKSLAYFADAEEDKMPELFFRVTWSTIKRYFQREAERVARSVINLS